MGWGYHHPGAADIVSWKYGDLNRDGVTNIGDFVALRSAMGESAAGLDLGALLGGPIGASVPEPHAVMLLCCGLALMAWRCRHSRR
jgi:hypothetical protein